MNEYDILLEIFRFIRDYSTSAYRLSDVCRKLMKHLADSGYTATITNENRDSKVVTIEGHRYRILRHDGWSTYDVIRTA